MSSRKRPHYAFEDFQEYGFPIERSQARKLRRASKGCRKCGKHLPRGGNYCSSKCKRG